MPSAVPLTLLDVINYICTQQSTKAGSREHKHLTAKSLGAMTSLSFCASVLSPLASLTTVMRVVLENTSILKLKTMSMCRYRRLSHILEKKKI